MKKIFVIIILFSFVKLSIAQDQLIKKDGSTIAAKVIEITPTDIKYKKATNVDGPTYSIPKRSLVRIQYANGEKEDLLTDIIYKKDGSSIDAKILEVTATQIKYKPLEEEAKVQTMLKSEAAGLEYANGEKVNFLPDYINKRDGSATIEAKVLETTGSVITYKLYNDQGGATKSIPKQEVFGIVYSDGKIVDYKDWVDFGADNFLLYSKDGTSVITDISIAGDVYLCYWNLNLELQRKYFLFKQRDPNDFTIPELTKKYYWQVAADDGAFTYNRKIYSSNGNEIPLERMYMHIESDDYPAAFSPTGEKIIVPYKKFGDIGTIWLYDKTGKKVKPINGMGGTWLFQFAHSGKSFFVGRKNMIEIFDMDGNKLSKIKLDNVLYPSLARYSFDDTWIYANNNKNEFGIWNTDGKQVALFDRENLSSGSISRDGKAVALYGYNPVKVKVKNGKEVEISAGFIEIKSIEGSLLKKIELPLGPSFVEFTPDAAGIVVVVDKSAIWLWKSDDYKVPEDAIKILNRRQLAIAQGESDYKEERRANFWSNALVGAAEFGVAYAEGREKFNAEKKAEEEREAARVAAADSERQRMAQQQNNASQTGATTAVKCKYAFLIEENTPGKVYISNVYSVSADKQYRRSVSDDGRVQVVTEFLVYPSRENARDIRKDKYNEALDTYGARVETKSISDQCQP